jgi:hypothetical protein
MLRSGKVGLGLLLLLLVVWPVPVLAQGGGTLDYGVPAQGTITDNGHVLAYTFEGTANDVVIIEMTAASGDLDPLLELVDPSGRLLITNDDISGDDRNARIQPFALPVTGTYQINATRYNRESGISTGTFSLRVDRVEEPAATEDALPALAVDYQLIEYNVVRGGRLAEAGTQYYLFAGEAGDIVVGILQPQDPAIQPVVRFYDTDLNQLSDSFNREEGGVATYYVLPTAGWYLIKVATQGGGGEYELETVGFPAQWVTYGDFVSGNVTESGPNSWYVFDARYGDTIAVAQTATDGDLVPYIVLADSNLNDLGNTVVGENPAGLRYTIPRSGQYVLLVSREGLGGGSTTGSFDLRLDGTPIDVAILDAQPIGYGGSLRGEVTNADPVAYFGFQGKRGDRVTIAMRADNPAVLDAYLLLTDSGFNELAVSDNAGETTNARIFQYELPASGDYYIMATRPQMAAGQGAGAFSLELLAGDIELTTGAVEATLRWNHEADLDLQVRDPGGETVGAGRRQIASGGVLEIDTNADCLTTTTLPLEHIYWPQDANLPGVYEFVVDYQLDCENRGPVTFDLTILVGGRQITRINDTLNRGQQYRLSVTVDSDGFAQVNGDGAVLSPSASLPVDSNMLVYGDVVSGTIDDARSVELYEFYGQAGDQIEITMRRQTGDLDPFVLLLDEAGNRVAEDDDGAGDRNAALRFTLTATGTYQIAATRYLEEAGVTTGDFELTVQRTG